MQEVRQEISSGLYKTETKKHTFFSSSFLFGKTPTVRTDASFVRARVACTAKSAELAQGSFLQRFIIPKTGMSPNTDRIVFRRRLGREPSENIISFDLSTHPDRCRENDRSLKNDRTHQCAKSTLFFTVPLSYRSCSKRRHFLRLNETSLFFKCDKHTPCRDQSQAQPRSPLAYAT